MSTVPPAPGWDLEQSPFHDGELAVQARVGVREMIDQQGRRAVRRYLTPQHREFYPLLPYIFVGSVDASGQPWASVLFGQPGFVDPFSDLNVRVQAHPLPGDPLERTLRPGAELALLGVQLHTRRRNRIIGTVSAADASGFTLDVRQTLGICPQYIQGREITFDRDPAAAPSSRPTHRAPNLDAPAKAIIGKADTYFVASNNPRAADGVTRGADVSHRGGRPGFVRVDDDTTLTVPDFVGNFIFNTLGNWQIDDRAGLLFLDFESGDALYVAARAEIIWDGPEVRAFAGAERLIRYHVHEAIRVEASLPGHFSAPDYSPLLGRTGTWQEAEAATAAERLRTAWRPFRVIDISDESATIRSFRLAPADGAGLVTYKPGQYLPIRVKPEGWAEPALRTYSLSDAPDGRSYRISVKREGRGGVSDWLHDHFAIGDEIEALSPRGNFAFDEQAGRPLLLISAGAGITPMVAILNALLVNHGRTRLHQPIYFLHAARNGSEHAFAAHLRQKAQLHGNLAPFFVYSQPRASDRLGETHHAEGRIDRDLLRRLLPLDDYEVYLCGPSGFMQSIYDALLALGLRDARIHAESFGASSIARRPETLIAASDQSDAVQVEFAKSGKTALWRPSSGSLLELAEQSGVRALHACRSGVCGTCATRLISGEVEYTEPPAHEIAPGEALICVARPRPGPHIDEHTQHRVGVTLDL